MPTFNVTYAIYTEESVECGDAEERGFIDENLSLRDAVRLVNQTRTNRVSAVECIEANEWPCVAPRSITITNGMEYETGDHEERSLHIPHGVTPASRRRIARLLGVRA